MSAEPMVALTWGACEPSDEARQEAFQLLHDDLIIHNPVRLDAVRVNYYVGAAAEDILAKVGVADTPEGRGLIRFLADRPGWELVGARVTVPAAHAGPRGTVRR